MKKVTIALALCVLTVASFGCTANTNTSANTTNLNLNNSVAETNSNSVNQNVANANSRELPAEVPVFDDARAAFEAGKKYFEDNEDENAVKAFEQAVKLDPNFGEAYFNLGIAYEVTNKGEDAPVVETKGGKNKKPAETPAEKAFKSAIKSYESFLKKNPKDAAAHFYLGLSYEKINEDHKALKSLQQAVKLQNEDTEYYYELGQIYNKLAQYEEAISALKKSLQFDPENTRAEAALEKAEAGKKRVDAAKPKDKPQPPEPEQPQRPNRKKAPPKVSEEKPKETAPAAPTPNNQ